MSSDSSKPGFWDTRYRDGVTPWDAGRVPPRLALWLRSQPRGRRVLVPGCGSGYEVEQFVAHGDDVLGIDFSAAALERARKLALPVRQADFFALDEPPFDVVYERTFLCALPRSRCGLQRGGSGSAHGEHEGAQRQTAIESSEERHREEAAGELRACRSRIGRPRPGL